MKKFRFKYHKIASAMITNIPLLKKIAKTKIHTLISTGMSNYKNIDAAVKIFKNLIVNLLSFTLRFYISCKRWTLESKMYTNIKKYKCDVGYSGHESSVSPSIIAYMLGASVIERHITLDRSIWGTDQASSLSEVGMKTLTSIIEKT